MVNRRLPRCILKKKNVLWTMDKVECNSSSRKLTVKLKRSTVENRMKSVHYSENVQSLCTRGGLSYPLLFFYTYVNIHYITIVICVYMYMRYGVQVYVSPAYLDGGGLSCRWISRSKDSFGWNPSGTSKMEKRACTFQLILYVPHTRIQY